MNENTAEPDYTVIADHGIRSEIEKHLSEMFDDHDENEIYPTSRFMWRLERYILSELAKAKLTTVKEIASVEVVELIVERDEARDWVKRMQNKERALTCAFCGQEYPPGTDKSNDDALTEHIKVCTKHPMRAVEDERLKLECEAGDLADYIHVLDDAVQASGVADEARAADPDRHHVEAIRLLGEKIPKYEDSLRNLEEERSRLATTVRELEDKCE